ncbi:MAG: hypothetical protein H6970_15390 [Gammaproteobacteria bacterium]|nr:hypothetical protein [Gammaproteobacteria bacterium]MCP5458714.1 hypothetical protein [Gammaproteobacteria bacterium]
MSEHSIEEMTERLLEPITVLAEALDASGFSEDWLGPATDPSAVAALPASLQTAVAAYLATVPGYPDDRVRLAEEHRVRLDLFRGDAELIPEEDILELGLSLDDSGDG